MGRMRFDLGGDRKRGGFVLSLVLGALLISSFLIVLSGCTTELIETINKMVDFYNRDDKAGPVVLFTAPDHGEDQVKLNVKFTATFDEEMDPETINNSTFIVNDGLRNISGTITYLEEYRMVIFSPDSKLFQNNKYTARLTTDIRDRIGNRLSEEWAWFFWTDVSGAEDIDAPEIIYKKPKEGDPPVSLNSVVSVNFNESLDPSTVNQSSLTISGIEGSVSGTVTYIDGSNTLKFTPDANLGLGQSYTIHVDANLSDLAGNMLGSYPDWNFQAGTAPDTDPPGVSNFNPGTWAINVTVDADKTDVIWVEFDEPMNEETINSKYFYLETGGLPVKGYVAYDPDPDKNPATETSRAVFRPLAQLQYITEYRVIVSSAVEDMAGNQLGSAKSWYFITVASDASASSVDTTIARVGAGPKEGLITAYVDFVNENRVHLPGLTRYHFELEERINSKDPFMPVKLYSVEKTPQSKTIALLVDINETMAKYWEPYIDALANFIKKLDPYDQVVFITFASDGPFTVKAYPSSGPTSDTDELLSILKNDLAPVNGYLSVYIFDAIWLTMDRLAGTPSGHMNAVVSFTNADPKLISIDTYNFEDCIDYSKANRVPIYSIVLSPADEIEELQHIGKYADFYYAARDPRELSEIYLWTLEYMDKDFVQDWYSVAWYTEGYGGDTVDVNVLANYPTVSNPGGPPYPINDSDQELGYVIP